MSWSSTTSVASALATNYLHDFDSGIFTLPFNISPGYELLHIPGFGPISGQNITTPDFWQPSSVGTSANGIVNNPTSGFSVSVLAPGSVGPNVLNPQGGIGNIVFAGQTFTRTHVLTAGGYGTYGAILTGPYVIAYDTAGIKTVSLYLYGRNGNAGYWDNRAGIPPIGVPQVPTFAPAKTFSFELVQTAVSVTRRNNNTGPVIADGTSINDMDTLTNSIIVLDKTNNRGDSIQSVWKVFKQDVTTGVYNVASSGSDYTLGLGEVLTDDDITLTWVSPGNYRIINSSIGSSAAGTNESNSVINFNVGQSVLDVVTLPTVISSVIAVTAFDNTVISTSPLTGVTTFEITASGTIDASAASWEQSVNAGPANVLTLTQAAWESELTHRCDIKCKVKLGTTLVATRIGLGPHTFSLAEGTYDVGYEVTPKSGGILVIPLTGTVVR